VTARCEPELCSMAELRSRDGAREPARAGFAPAFGCARRPPLVCGPGRWHGHRPSGRESPRYRSRNRAAQLTLTLSRTPCRCSSLAAVSKAWQWALDSPRCPRTPCRCSSLAAVSRAWQWALGSPRCPARSHLVRQPSALVFSGACGLERLPPGVEGQVTLNVSPLASSASRFELALGVEASVRTQGDWSKFVPGHWRRSCCRQPTCTVTVEKLSVGVAIPYAGEHRSARVARTFETSRYASAQRACFHSGSHWLDRDGDNARRC